MISTGCQKFLEWRKTPKYLIPRKKQIYVRVSSLGSGSQLLSNGREQGWDIPSAPFRDGRGICPLPLPTNIFHQGEKGFVGLYLEFPLLAGQSVKGDFWKCRVCPGRARELLGWEQLCDGFALWGRAGTQRVKSSSQASPPHAAFLITPAQEGIPWLP